MAHIYPDPISPDTDSSAERRLYTLFRDELPDEYTVIHGCKWVARNLSGGSREGECDFIIVHPNYGALCIEVKGGGIRVDTSDGQEKWFSTDKTGTEHQLKRSPIAQVKDSQYALRDKIRDDNRTNKYWNNVGLSIRWAVSFPDVEAKRSYNFGADTPADLIIDGAKLEDIRSTIEAIFAYWHGNKGLNSNNQPNIAGAKALVDVLAPSWELKALKSIAFASITREIEKLTQDQFIILHDIVGVQRGLVTGGAGTGKTVLAMELARRLASEEKKTLYLCFNRNLVNRVTSIIGNTPNLSVMSFNGLVRYFANVTGIAWNPPHDTTQLFDEYLPNLLSDAVGKSDEQSLFDAIVIDEAQDFRKYWWLSIEDMFDEEDGRLYVFYDNNQAIYTSVDELVIDIKNRFRLYTNCRNTKNIHDAFQPYTTAHSICLAGEGSKVEKISIEASNQKVKLLKNLLLTLTNKENVNAKDITVLTPRAEGSSSWLDGLQIGTLTLTWDLERARSSQNFIGVSTVHSYKGLENTVIILTEMENANNRLQTELAYIGISRACVQLYILGDLPLPT